MYEVVARDKANVLHDFQHALDAFSSTATVMHQDDQAGILTACPLQGSLVCIQCVHSGSIQAGFCHCQTFMLGLQFDGALSSH